jgi:hypothetical protein
MDRYLPASYGLTFLWGIAVLLGLIGLGRIVQLALGTEVTEKPGWGLQAVWGMAAYLLVGGCLSMLGACGAMAITLLIVCGLVVMIWTTVRGGWPARAAWAAFPWRLWPAFLVLGFLYAGGLFWTFNVNASDDLPAYYNYCEKLLSTGSFADPFSWRRLASLGGHTLLECSVLSQTSWSNVQAFEVALCPVILLGLMMGFRGGALARSPLGLFLMLLAITTPIIRVNTASHFTGIVIFLGLFATLDLIDRTGGKRLRLWMLAGLVGAGFCSLRAQNVPAAVGTLGLFWMGLWCRGRLALRPAITEACCWGAGLLAGLLPWMIMSAVSQGTPLFPLFPGTNNAAFNPQAVDGSLHERFAPVFSMVFNAWLVPWLLCLLAIPSWRRALPALAVAIPAVGTALLLAYATSLAPDTTTIPRYVQPVLFTAALAALMTAALERRGRTMAWALGILVVAAGFQMRCDDLWRRYVGLNRMNEPVAPLSARVTQFNDAQALVPAGKRILVCSDYPFLFDHQRNPIWIIDMPHACSPAPGLPYHRPPEETAKYLRSLGVEYVIFADFEKSLSLYKRSAWQANQVGTVALWKIQAPFFLDFFDTMERLAAAGQPLGRVGDCTVLRLNP